MATIRWGIIGCGDVTEVKSGPGFQKSHDSELVAVMRRDARLAEDYAKRHGVPRWYDDARQLVADPEVDAVYVATPPSAHKEGVALCAEAGKPVLVEKPIAPTFQEAEETTEICRRAGLPMFVAYYRRAMPIYLKVKELIDAGAIGTPRCVVLEHFDRVPEPGFDTDGVPWRFVPEIGGGGRFVDMGCHQFDLLDFLLGPVTKIQGMAANRAGLYPAEDTVVASFEFANGALGTGSWCFVVDKQMERTQVLGTAGEVTFSMFAPEPVIVSNAEGTVEHDIGYPQHVHQPLIQSVVDHLNGTGTCQSTGETGLRASWVIDAVLKDYREGRKTS